MVGRSADERLTASWKGKEGLRGQLTIRAENLQQAVDAFGTTGREWAERVCGHQLWTWKTCSAKGARTDAGPVHLATVHVF